MQQIAAIDLKTRLWTCAESRGEQETGVTVRIMSAQPHWRTSSHTKEFDCVEVADLQTAGIALRDSKDSSGPRLVVGRTEFALLVGQVKGERL